MNILWDEPKRLANLAKHGLDLADLDPRFFENSLIAAANLGRLVAVGRLNDGVVTVVFVTLGTEGVSIISMRRASRKERRLIDG